MNLNRAILIGRVTQSPELRTTPSGQQVCNFSVATNRTWTNQETKEKQERAEFHNIVAWSRLAEIANQYLNKGTLVMIEGRIETRSWIDQSGNKRYRTEIIAENMQLGPRPSPKPAEGAANLIQNIPVVMSDEPIVANDKESEVSEEGEINVKNIPF